MDLKTKQFNGGVSGLGTGMEDESRKSTEVVNRIGTQTCSINTSLLM
jgi:hypothetical protein